MSNEIELRKQAAIRGLLLVLEKDMGLIPDAILGDTDELPVTHTFSNGIYTREIRIPKGIFVMGKIHIHEHPNYLVAGSVIMMTEAGVEKITAPKVMLSPAGTKRFLFTLEDTIWITVHRTDATNKEDAEVDVIVSSYEDYDLIANNSNLKLEVS